MTMTNESIKIDGWTIHPHFDQRTGKLEEVELLFETKAVQICEIRIPNENGRIDAFDDGISLCLKPRREEEKYGAWMQIKPSETDVCAFKEWLSR